MGLYMNTVLSVIYAKDKAAKVTPLKLIQYLESKRSPYDTDYFSLTHCHLGIYDLIKVEVAERLWVHPREYFPTADVVSKAFPQYTVISE